MNRRQFLSRTLAASAVAAACPLAMRVADTFTLDSKNAVVFENLNGSTSIDRSGTVTGRVTGRATFDTPGLQQMFARQSGKSKAADMIMYRRSLQNPDAKILHVTAEGNKLIRYGNKDFAELEKRVAASFRLPSEVLRETRREDKILQIAHLYGMKVT